MDPDLRARLEAALADNAEQLAALHRQHEEVVAASRDSNADDEHDPEGATIAFERQQVVALTGQLQRSREDLLRALEQGDGVRHLRALRRADRRRAARGPADRPDLHRLRFPRAQVAQPASGVCAGSTRSATGGGGGGVPSPNGLPPRASRPCGLVHPDRSGPFGTMPVGLMLRCTS